MAWLILKPPSLSLVVLCDAFISLFSFVFVATSLRYKTCAVFLLVCISVAFGISELCHRQSNQFESIPLPLKEALLSGAVTQPRQAHFSLQVHLRGVFPSSACKGPPCLRGACENLTRLLALGCGVVLFGLPGLHPGLQ